MDHEITTQPTAATRTEEAAAAAAVVTTVIKVLTTFYECSSQTRIKNTILAIFYNIFSRGKVGPANARHFHCVYLLLCVAQHIKCKHIKALIWHYIDFA